MSARSISERMLFGVAATCAAILVVLALGGAAGRWELVPVTRAGAHVDAPQGRVAIVVSHNHVIRLRLAALLGLPLADYRRRFVVDPGSYSLIAVGGVEPPALTAIAVQRLGVLAPEPGC